jgi:hypothetical protein
MGLSMKDRQSSVTVLSIEMVRLLQRLRKGDETPEYTILRALKALETGEQKWRVEND